MNTAAVRHESAASDGACSSTVPLPRVRVQDDWVFVGRREWEDPDARAPIRLTLFVRNWSHADGPYVVAWDKLSLSGTLDPDVSAVLGRGEFSTVATGALSELTNVRDMARFSLLATEPDAAGSYHAAFGFRMGELELASLGIGWVLMHSRGVSFGGEATVNDLRGFRFELRATDGGSSDGPDRLNLDLFSASNGYTVPVFSTFGDVPAEGINVRVP